MDTLHHFFLFLMFLHYAIVSSDGCLKIVPDSISKIPVTVGKNFTATCHVLEGSGYESNDIEWLWGNTSIAKQHYHKINETSVSVTVNITSNIKGWLICKATRKSLSFKQPCTHGISLHVGYPPLKPENLTCIAVQEGNTISPGLKCYWEPGSRDPLLDTTYTLFAEVGYTTQYSGSCNQKLVRSCTVNLSTFPSHMSMTVRVEVKNALGSVLSDELSCSNALSFVKLNPPLDVQGLAEKNFPTSLMVTWKHPIDIYQKITYAIRYCQVDSDVWIEVPESVTQAHTDSFRLQSLEPFTEYVVQMRCFIERHQSYWSDWSANTTVRTAEDKPGSAPDLWRIIQPTSDKRKVTLVWKPPVKANGRILHYSLGFSQDSRIFDRHVEKADNSNYSMELPPGKMVIIEITAVNLVGESPKETLLIPKSDQELPGVKSLSWSVRGEELQVEWSRVSSLPNVALLSEYLLEWVNVHQGELHPHWQRCPHNVNTTTLSGFEKKKRYNVSVYPIYKRRFQSIWHFQAGRPVTVAAYIQQAAPGQGPTATVTKSKKNSAELTWKEVPLDSQCGFITNYTIFYRTGNTEHWQSVMVDANIHSHVLTDLASETDYVVHIMASTVAGSKNGSDFNFKTMKYGDGEVEVIVVVVCLSFLFLTVFIIMFCLRKREVIKKLLWPQVPDPSDSSIAHWSPDFPIKADMPKEDVSVVEVDVFDGKSLCEEDKAVLPLKKDKYLSEEHSSGIGGSSCMSSPRHSVSDSDESDSGQTTASTVQYSSVVAASGYKGQTPNHQPPVFARSESTQPLLDCEEHPDLLNESGGHSRNSYFRRGRELETGALTQDCDEPNGISLTFCPVQEEETSPTVEDSPATGVCYMPQQNGYRPQ